MAKVEIREPNEADVVELVAKMRPQDRKEVCAMGFAETDAEIEDVILRSIKQSRGTARAARLDGDLLCIAGVVTRAAMAIEGYPWMLASPLIETPTARRIFGARCKANFEKIIPPGVIRLSNYVDETNDISIGWLKWMGFSFGADRYDFNGVRWVRFEMVADNVR